MLLLFFLPRVNHTILGRVTLTDSLIQDDSHVYVCMACTAHAQIAFLWEAITDRSPSPRRRVTLTALHMQAVSMWSCSSSGGQVVERFSSSSRYPPYQRKLFHVCMSVWYVCLFLVCLFLVCLFLVCFFFVRMYISTMHVWNCYLFRFVSFYRFPRQSLCGSTDTTLLNA